MREGNVMKHIRRFVGYFLLSALVFALSLFAQASLRYEKEITLFEDFVQKQMQTDHIPGLSVAFMKDDFIWAKGFGWADLENKTPATARSAYRLASNTKSMTAVAVLQWGEKGKIDLDAEVQTYVPYFPRKRWPVTVRQLLGHLGGISHYRNYDAEGHIKEHKDTRESLEIFADFELVAEPGTKYNYSSYGYNLLGAVIEGAAKEPYADYMRENLWRPLEMTDTSMDDPTEILPNRVRGYRLVDGEVKNSEFVDISSRFAGGGTRSTVLDLLKYAKGFHSFQMLSPKSIDLMLTSMATQDGHFTDYGMGWSIVPVNGRFHVSHTGAQAETRTLLLRFPKINFAIALAYNFEGGNLFAYAHRLAQLILDEPWNRTVYTGSKEGNAFYSGLADVFNYGFAYFDRYEKPQTSDPKELAEAFSYFNTVVHLEALRSDFKKTAKKIADGRHPVAQEAFVKIGSYMAARLKENLSDMGMLHRMGALRFFHAYVQMYRNLPDYPADLTFSEAAEKQMDQWQSDWEKTYTDTVRRLSITAFSDIDRVGKELKKIFSGATVYPDFSGDLAQATHDFYVKGDREGSFRAAKLACELYPQSPGPYVYLANAYACFGQKEKALESYQRAIQINGDDRVVSAGNLDRIANDLAYFGKRDEAVALLTVVLELYPKEAILHQSMGDLFLEKGKSYYRKAVELDPMLEPARDRLKKLR